MTIAAALLAYSSIDLSEARKPMARARKSLLVILFRENYVEVHDAPVVSGRISIEHMDFRHLLSSDSCDYWRDGKRSSRFPSKL